LEDLEDLLRDVEDVNDLMIRARNDTQIFRTSSCLHWAIYYKNYNAIKYLIEQKGAKVDFAARTNPNGPFDLNCILETDTLLLHDERDEPDLKLLAKILKYLVSQGASINHNIVWGNGVRGPTLSLYIRYLELEQVRLLIETANADVNQVDSEGHPPLYHALHLFEPDLNEKTIAKIEFIIHLLDSYDADFEHQDAYGNTLLMQFAKQGNSLAVSHLLNIPVDTSAKNLDEKNALDHALDALGSKELMQHCQFIDEP
jgi:ankyrin repeat protein